MQRYSLIKCGVIDDYSLIKCDFKIRIMERLAINKLLKWKNKLVTNVPLYAVNGLEFYSIQNESFLTKTQKKSLKNLHKLA